MHLYKSQPEVRVAHTRYIGKEGIVMKGAFADSDLVAHCVLPFPTAQDGRPIRIELGRSEGRSLKWQPVLERRPPVIY